MLWSYVDWQMAMLLAAIMKADTEASVAIFLTLRNARAQRDVLIAAADMTLSAEHRDVFDAVMLLYGSLQAQRADIAHGIFGHVDVDDDNIVPWIETKKISKEWIEKFHKLKREGVAPEADANLGQKRETFIYKITDLEKLAEEIYQFWGITFGFTSLLRFPDLPLTARTFESQCSWPQMQSALSEIRNRKNGTTPA
ncbi:hypothetical protein AYJ54_08395 [Bradyrhizobium centrolobii]|uniref:Uncharacterized protein n=2 Tax=Bradyrhizobium centrolobii TaxID=1505087 RepID=A0A176YUM9_9BRAD|nr:hypothetical protein AYJ54_08395 [Bradyrhizobium centrolobii]